MSRPPEKPRRDIAGDLEGSLFESLGELHLAAQVLALHAAAVQATALALAEARGREEEQLLAELLQTEDPSRGTKAGKGGHGRHGR